MLSRHFQCAEPLTAVGEIARILLITFVQQVVVQCGLALVTFGLDGFPTV